MSDDEVVQRFTLGAIRVVQRAKQEARRLGADTVAPEHLLLGVARGEGVGADALSHLGVTADRLDEAIGRSAPGAGKAGGPACQSPRWSPQARRVLEAACDEARELNLRLGRPIFVDTEHMLLGLLRDGGPASGLLRELGAEPERIRQTVIGLLGGSCGRALRDEQPQQWQQWVDAAVRLGAKEAKIISPASVVTAAWVRLKCQYGCGGYGKRLTCPPHSPTPEQTRAVLDCYRKAVLVHCPSEGEWEAIGRIVAALEREVFLAGHYKAFAFGSGPCELCEECSFEDCAHPEQARPSMEAAGIDVYATARGNGFPIEVVRDRSCPQNYYGLVLIE